MVAGAWWAAERGAGSLYAAMLPGVGARSMELDAAVLMALGMVLGAVAASLGEPSLAAVQEAAVEVLGRKAEPAVVRNAVAEGYRCLS